MRKLKILLRIMKNTGADRILLGFLGFYMICTVIVWIVEPGVTSWWDAVWYCYAVITTIGFGDVLVTTVIAKVVSMVLSVYAVLVIAIITSVVVNYFDQIVQIRQSETIAAILDRLEHLPQMSREELEGLSENIRKLRSKRKM